MNGIKNKPDRMKTAVCFPKGQMGVGNIGAPIFLGGGGWRGLCAGDV